MKVTINYELSALFYNRRGQVLNSLSSRGSCNFSTTAGMQNLAHLKTNWNGEITWYDTHPSGFQGPTVDTQWDTCLVRRLLWHDISYLLQAVFLTIKKILNILVTDNLTLVLQMKSMECKVHPKEMVPGSPRECAHYTALPPGLVAFLEHCAHAGLTGDGSLGDQSVLRLGLCWLRTR